jgi:hypothetical protein
MRQAVVVIHGIGEQRPMDTVRGFVKAVVPRQKIPISQGFGASRNLCPRFSWLELKPAPSARAAGAGQNPG